MHGPNEQKGEDYSKDSYFLGEGEFSLVNKSSMTFWYPDPPKIDIMPRHNVYHPDDMLLAVDERRIIGSLRNNVRCFQLERHNVCPTCKIDRSTWVAGQTHECMDAGPANPSMRRQKSKVRYGKRQQNNWRTFKKANHRKSGIHFPPGPAKMPEHHLSSQKEQQDSILPHHRQRKRQTLVDSQAMALLQEKHSDIHPDILSKVLTTILELSPDKDGTTYANGDPMALSQQNHPGVTAETLQAIVHTVLSMPADGTLGKRSAATDLSPDSKMASTSTNNQYYVLDTTEQADPATLTSLTQ